MTFSTRRGVLRTGLALTVAQVAPLNVLAQTAAPAPCFEPQVGA